MVGAELEALSEGYRLPSRRLPVGSREQSSIIESRLATPTPATKVPGT
jgi:hypothetical protein